MSRPRFLLDTHILFWSLYQPQRVPQAIAKALSVSNDSFVSAATVWETEIKRSKGKLDDMPDSLWEDTIRVGHIFLPITPHHAYATAHLPPIHKDPMDRVLVAQARIEDLTLLTVDKALRRYAVKLV